MSLQTRIGDLITAIATDIKQHRTWMTGSSSGTLSGLTTTDKTSLVNAINEVKSSSSGAPPDATTSVKGIVELATLAEAATGTDTVRAVTPEAVRQEINTLKSTLLGGVSSSFDTLKELYDQIAADESTASALATLVGTKANSSDVYTKTELGNPETDLAAAYATAKA